MLTSLPVRNRKQSGTALVLALIVVGLVASAGAAYLQFMTSVSRTQAHGSDTTSAFYLAEAGLAEAFVGVKAGRTGQIGSMEAPARFGNGLLWVDAVTTEDDQVRLTSTGMVGTGTATLSYVLEPTMPLLGVFSDQDVVVDQVLMIDGYNSEEGSYQDQVVRDFTLPDPIPAAAESFLTQESAEGIPVACHLGYHNWCTGSHEHSLLYGDTETPEGQQAFDDRNLSHAGQLATWRAQLDQHYRDAILSEKAKGAGKGKSPKPSQDVPIKMLPPVGRTTGYGGVLGSNGSIQLSPGGETIQEIVGDLLPGLGGSAQVDPQALVSGQTGSQTATVALPPVAVPDLTKQPAVVHTDILPMEIGTGEHAYHGLEVATDGELILRGPATVVVGQLTLQPGATLTLDTRSGDISLFITEGMDLQRGSATISLGENPKSMTLQVDEIASMEGERPVHLDATSQFFGTIYSPDTEVYLGSDFELFGTVIAKKLVFGAGAKMHVDHAGTQGSAAPDIISWRILEVPDTIKGKGHDPFTILGVNKKALPELAKSHDLAGVTLKVEYLDFGGSTQRYNGPESDFNWALVQKVVVIQRTSRAKPESPSKSAGAPQAAAAP